jgi:hypothetical protein
VDAMRATQGAATDESPEADHPAYKYQVSSPLLAAHHADASEPALQAGAPHGRGVLLLSPAPNLTNHGPPLDALQRSPGVACCGCSGGAAGKMRLAGSCLLIMSASCSGKLEKVGSSVTQHAEVQGDTRADDTGVSGMPADRPTATPAEGLGNQPDANAPEPKGGILRPCRHTQHWQMQPADLHVVKDESIGASKGCSRGLLLCWPPVPACSAMCPAVCLWLVVRQAT